MSESSQPPPTVAVAPPGLWARGTEGEKAAIVVLAQRYWYPAYVWLRASGNSPDDSARQCAQFFTRLRDASPPARDEPTAARFRDYALARLKEYLIAGFPAAEGEPAVAIDPQDAERRFADEPTRAEDELFARRWSLRVLELAMGALKDEYAAVNKLPLYEAMKPFLGFNANETGYSEAGKSVAMSGSAFHLQVFHFRKRYRAHLRSQITDTVRHGDDVDSELTVLLLGAS